MFGMGPTEMIIVLLIILLVFGAKRIPEIAKGLGQGITEFKRAAKEVTDEIEMATDSTSPRPKNELKNQSNKSENSSKS
jgi:sec-independent protein translocase protein TatA